MFFYTCISEILYMRTYALSIMSLLVCRLIRK